MAALAPWVLARNITTLHHTQQSTTIMTDLLQLTTVTTLLDNFISNYGFPKFNREVVTGNLGLFGTLSKLPGHHSNIIWDIYQKGHTIFTYF